MLLSTDCVVQKTNINTALVCLTSIFSACDNGLFLAFLYTQWKLAFGMSLAIAQCLPAKVINAIGSWLSSLEMCSYAKWINAEYNWLLGWKDSTCETNRRNMQVVLSVQHFAFAKLSHTQCPWLRPMKTLQMLYSTTHTSTNSQCVRLRTSSKHNTRDSFNARLHMQSSSTHNKLNCFHIQILHFPS